MKILAIGSHPDDIEIGCAGTLLHFKHNHNAEIHILLMTIGSKGNTEHLCRNNEQHNACTILGVDSYHCAGLRDTEIQINQAIHAIEFAYENINPDYTFTHYKDDTHQDHRTVSEATISALRYENSILFYETLSTENFHPTMLVDISNWMDKKSEIIGAHTSQNRTQSIVAYAKNRAIFRSYRTSLKYVEGFIPRKFIWQ